MRTARQLAFLIAVLALATTFGCDDSSSSSPVVPDDDLLPQDVTFFNFDDALDGIEDMTLDQPMTFSADFTNSRAAALAQPKGPVSRMTARHSAASFAEILHRAVAGTMKGSTATNTKPTRTPGRARSVTSSRVSPA